MQFFVTLIAINKIEITTGKLNTAISMLLLFAFDAIPDSRVNDDAKPNDANTSVTMKINR